MRQKSDEDDPGGAHHRCVGILRHLLKYRPDIAVAVHKVSKTLALPGDTDLRRLRRLGRYLVGTQKLGIMTRKCKDPEHLDAYTDAVCSGNSINRQSTSGGILKIGSATLREVTKGQRCQTLSSGDSEYYAAVTTTAARGIIQRQGRGPLKHIETRLLWLQAKHEEKQLTVVKELTQTNTAGGFTALQTAKYLGWRNRLSMGYDNGEDVEKSKREALAESGRWARVEAQL